MGGAAARGQRVPSLPGDAPAGGRGGSAPGRTREGHLAAWGINEGAATRPIGSLAPAQKARLLVAATTLRAPHLTILDEPTNHLDIDTLGSLVEAARSYQGALIVITHNQKQFSHLCPENWHIENFKVMIRGATWQDDAEWLARRLAASQLTAARIKHGELPPQIDALGNVVEEPPPPPKKMSKAELKKLKKRVAAKRREGEDVNTDDEAIREGYQPPSVGF